MSTLPKFTAPTALAPDALGALERAGFSRRSFLKGAGALIVTFSASGMVGTAFAQGRGGGPPDPGAIPAGELDSWIAIGSNGNVTAYAGKCELGQGISTAQAQLVAEELCVPFERVNLIYCDTSITPDQGTTSGSGSTPTNFNNRGLAQASATAREALIRLASQRLNLPADQLTAANGVITARNDPSRRVSYGDLIGGRKFELQVDANAQRKPHSEWTVLGTPVRRPDIAGMVMGQIEYVHNVRLPAMLHGRVVRPPVVGATVVSVDESSVAGMPGVVRVLVKNNFVGVVAQKPWQAIQAAERLRVNWSAGTGMPSFANFYQHLRNQTPTRDTLVVDSKDVQQKLSEAPTVLRATYYHPYQMHGSLGTSCAVADVRGDRATIYSPTQNVWGLRSSTSILLGLERENVRVIFRRGSGCYGLNGADTASYDAALLSQAVGRPVRVQLSRKDEMAWENYGEPFIIEERVGLDAQGNVIAWDHESWSANRGGRPGGNTPGNVITGTLAGLEPRAFTPRSPAPEPNNFDNGDNDVPSYCAGGVGGESQGTGTITSERSLTHDADSSLYTAPLRSPWRLQNTFAHECFMDEVAAHVKADPVAFRLRYLRDPRLREALTTAARAANWEARPSPRAEIRRTGVASGRGVACVLYEGGNGYAAMIAEVDVNQDTGEVLVRRIVISNDSGPISNPDGLRNQMEGGALQGMSRALLEEVTWDNEKVTSADWATYRTLPLGFAVPTIECVLIDRPDQQAMGAGETAITIVAAAIGNAVFDATGARIRQVPFTPERVKAALAQRA